MKQHYTATAEPEDLARLDAWAKAHKMNRGAAIIALLDLAEGNFDIQAGGPFPPKDVRTPGPADGRMDEGGSEVTSAASSPQLRSPEQKAASLALASKVLELEQKRVGVHPTVLDGDELAKVHDPDADKSDYYERKDGRMPDLEKKSLPDSDYYDEYDQGGEP